jgi:DNA-binding transcriptional ArsR family regulator
MMNELPLSRAELFQVLAHPVRLQILEVLALGEANVSTLTGSLSQRQAYVSQQLMVLRDAGLVCDRREGSTIIYQLASPRITRFLAEALLVLKAPLNTTPEHPVSLETPTTLVKPIWSPEED